MDLRIISAVDRWVLVARHGADFVQRELVGEVDSKQFGFQRTEAHVAAFE